MDGLFYFIYVVLNLNYQFFLSKIAYFKFHRRISYFRIKIICSIIQYSIIFYLLGFMVWLLFVSGS